MAVNEKEERSWFWRKIGFWFVPVRTETLGPEQWAKVRKMSRSANRRTRRRLFALLWVPVGVRDCIEPPVGPSRSLGWADEHCLAGGVAGAVGAVAPDRVRTGFAGGPGGDGVRRGVRCAEGEAARRDLSAGGTGWTLRPGEGG